MEPHSLVQQSDLVAIFSGIAFCFGSIGCMMISVHLAKVRDFGGMKSLLKLAGGFTLASCCLLAATTCCVVHRCEKYCKTIAAVSPIVQADQIATQRASAADITILRRLVR